MVRKSMPIGGEEPLSRKRTADMIRQLRALTQELKMLKTRLEAEETPIEEQLSNRPAAAGRAIAA